MCQSCKKGKKKVWVSGVCEVKECVELPVEEAGLHQAVVSTPGLHEGGDLLVGGEAAGHVDAVAGPVDAVARRAPALPPLVEVGAVGRNAGAVHSVRGFFGHKVGRFQARSLPEIEILH